MRLTTEKTVGKPVPRLADSLITVYRTVGGFGSQHPTLPSLDETRRPAALAALAELDPGNDLVAVQPVLQREFEKKGDQLCWLPEAGKLVVRMWGKDGEEKRIEINDDNRCSLSEPTLAFLGMVANERAEHFGDGLGLRGDSGIIAKITLAPAPTVAEQDADILYLTPQEPSAIQLAVTELPQTISA